MTEPDRPQDEAPPTPPTFGQLFGANLRVLLLSLAFVVACWGVWLLLRLLFPDVGWLQNEPSSG